MDLEPPEVPQRRGRSVDRSDEGGVRHVLVSKIRKHLKSGHNRSTHVQHVGRRQRCKFARLELLCHEPLSSKTHKADALQGQGGTAVGPGGGDDGLKQQQQHMRGRKPREGQCR